MQLTIDRLTKQYQSKIAVDRVSLNLTNGVYGLLGANGAGKTTLMRMICGVLKPTSGEIKLDNISVNDEEYRNVLGYLPQDFGYYPEFTALEFLCYMSSLKGLLRRDGKAKATALLKFVALEEVANKRIKTFSGGMKQRLGIAQAMLNNPHILVLDEPTSGLDPKERVRFRNLIADLGRDKIVLLSTHIVQDVEYIADDILVMKKGVIIMHGTAQELAKSAEGKVFTATVPQEEADAIAANYCVANMHYANGASELRLIADEIPFECAVPVAPTLEDVYLYYFRDEQGA